MTASVNNTPNRENELHGSHLAKFQRCAHLTGDPIVRNKLLDCLLASQRREDSMPSLEKRQRVVEPLPLPKTLDPIRQAKYDAYLELFPHLPLQARQKIYRALQHDMVE